MTMPRTDAQKHELKLTFDELALIYSHRPPPGAAGASALGLRRQPILAKPSTIWSSRARQQKKRH
jgi:hypothetical protein